MSKISLKHTSGKVVSLNVPTTEPTATDVAFKLPNADGSAGQFMKTDGSGNLSFDTAGGGGKVLNYKQYQAVGTHSTASTSYGVISSNFSLDLPNVATNSNVLISFCAPKGSSAVDVVRFKAVRVKGGVSTDLGENTVADAAGRTSTMSNYVGGDNSNQIFHVAFQWWDMDPGGDDSTTITYEIHWAVSSGTGYLGQSDPASYLQRAGGTQFYVMEFAA